MHEACNDRAEVGEGSEQGRGADHLLGSCIHVATYIVVVVPPAGQTAAPAARFRTGGGGGSGRGSGIGGGGSMIGGGSEGSGGGTGGVPGGGIGWGPWACIASSLASTASAVKANAPQEHSRYAHAACAGPSKTACCAAATLAAYTCSRKSKIRLAAALLLPAV